MQIMSLNAWGGKLHTALLPYVAKTAPDILCLQEVIHSPDTEAPWLTYRDGDHVLPQRANLFHEIRQALPDHVATFCPAAQGALWDGDRPVPSQWGLATFVHKSFPIIAQAQGFVHKSWSPEGYGDHPRSRTAHAVRLHDFGRNRQISVTHMHGLRDPAGKHDTPARAAQARRLLDLSRQVSEPDDLTVICGDFNVEPGSETLALLRDAGMTDLVTAGGHPGTRSSHYAKPGKFADYMLVSRKTEIRAFQIIRDPEVSDHCPLVLSV